MSCASPEKFIGRKELLRDIKENVELNGARRHILLEAPRCSGKTSLLNVIKKNMQDSRIIVVMVDSKENHENSRAFLKKIFNDARQVIEGKIPDSVGKIDFSLQDPIKSFQELFDKIKDKFDLIILLVDDFDSLASNAGLMKDIERISTIEGYCLILAGENWIDSLRIDNLDPKELNGFERDEIIEYFNALNIPLTDNERKLMSLEQIVLAIGMITAGRPGAVKILAECIHKSYEKNRPNKIDAKLINHRLISRVLKKSIINCGKECGDELQRNWDFFDSKRKQIISDSVDSINENFKK